MQQLQERLEATEAGRAQLEEQVGALRQVKKEKKEPYRIPVKKRDLLTRSWRSRLLRFPRCKINKRDLIMPVKRPANACKETYSCTSIKAVRRR